MLNHDVSNILRLAGVGVARGSHDPPKSFRTYCHFVVWEAASRRK